jgi:glycosyltransferase involved in cell wall biosynthesis
MQAVFGEGIAMMGRRPSPLGVLPALLTSSQDVIVSANWIWPTAYGVHLARRLRRFRLVGFPIFHIARPWAEQLLYHEMLAACDAVLTLTDAEQQFVQARCRGRVEVTGAGVDPAPFVRRDGGAVRRLHNLGDGPVVGFIGRQDPLKGVLTLLEAMRLVWQARPEVRLLLGGPRAHRSREVSAALESLPAEHRPQLVDLSDFADRDGPSIIDACDVVALPSVEESFGLVFLEAWMCRKPVVGVRIPSTECVIEDGQDGLLARPMDPADLARCLLELLGDPGRAGMLGERGYRKTLARFTWDAVVDRWEAVLREVVEGSRRGSKGVEEG